MTNTAPVLLLLLVTLWVLPAVLVAINAQDKGHSFGLFLLLGLVASWVLALVVLLLVQDKRDTTASPAPASAHQDLDRIGKLAELHKAGALTDDEYEAEKARTLNQSRP
jgi:hypothetical protein